jgi:xylan 1,4-beta-xylosidase
MFDNPVIPGFHPDPSIVRVGQDYYLATSTFEYFPGVPIFHSRDLVHWRQIGHALTRASQLQLSSAPSSQGIYAPTLRHRNGTFYMIVNNVSAGGNFFVTATDPAGDWSEPIRITNDNSGGIDPSLFFDDDGKVYFTRHGGGERGGIFQAELDISTGRCAAPPVQIWAGTGGIWPEGPHLYKIGQYYYLLIAEGGTSYGHMVTIARATAPGGPYTSYSSNPILTHANMAANPIQATGHADLVQLPDGTWWMVFLGIRPWDGAHHHIGRETFLAPVGWTTAGWPVVNDRLPIGLRMSAAGLPPQETPPGFVARDEFTATRLGFQWNLLRNPMASLYSLTERPGFLRLAGWRQSLGTQGSPAFVGRRQQHLRARISALVDFTPSMAGHEAGLSLRMNELNHYDLMITQVGTERRIRLRAVVAGASTPSESALAAGPAVLSIEAYPDRYEFFVTSPPTGTPRSLGTAMTAPLSSESAGGFTGVYAGMYAWTGGASDTMPPADFDWFEYVPM